MKNQNNEKAFPSSDDLGVSNEGMTLRDYFAAKALNGIISNNEMWRAMCMDKDTHTSVEDYVAQQCYLLADAMLKERSK